MQQQWWKQGTVCNQMKDRTVSGNPEQPEKQSSLRTEGAIHKYKITRNYGKSEALWTRTVHVYTKTTR